MLDKATESGFI